MSAGSICLSEDFECLCAQMHRKMDERDSVKFDFERSKLICSEAPSRLALLRIEIDALEIKIKQEMIMMKIRNPEFWR